MLYFSICCGATAKSLPRYFMVIDSFDGEDRYIVQESMKPVVIEQVVIESDCTLMHPSTTQGASHNLTYSVPGLADIGHLTVNEKCNPN